MLHIIVHLHKLHIFHILILNHAVILIINYALLKIGCVIQSMLSGAIGVVAIAPPRTESVQTTTFSLSMPFSTPILWLSLMCGATSGPKSISSGSDSS